MNFFDNMTIEYWYFISLAALFYVRVDMLMLMVRLLLTLLFYLVLPAAVTPKSARQRRKFWLKLLDSFEKLNKDMLPDDMNIVSD